MFRIGDVSGLGSPGAARCCSYTPALPAAATMAGGIFAHLLESLSAGDLAALTGETWPRCPHSAGRRVAGDHVPPAPGDSHLPEFIVQ